MCISQLNRITPFELCIFLRKCYSFETEQSTIQLWRYFFRFPANWEGKKENKNWFFYSIIVLLLHWCRTHFCLTIDATQSAYSPGVYSFFRNMNKTNRSAWRKKQPKVQWRKKTKEMKIVRQTQFTKNIVVAFL